MATSVKWVMDEESETKAADRILGKYERKYERKLIVR